MHGPPFNMNPNLEWTSSPKYRSHFYCGIKRSQSASSHDLLSLFPLSRPRRHPYCSLPNEFSPLNYQIGVILDLRQLCHWELEKKKIVNLKYFLHIFFNCPSIRWVWGLLAHVAQRDFWWGAWRWSCESERNPKATQKHNEKLQSDWKQCRRCISSLVDTATSATLVQNPLLCPVQQVKRCWKFRFSLDTVEKMNSCWCVF